MLPPFSKGVELFKNISEAEFKGIARLCFDRRYPRGKTIFSEGDPSDALYILKDGLVKLISLSEKGTETILHILKPDEIFGELLFSERERALTAVAVEETLTTVISAEAFQQLLASVPTLALNFIRLLSKRLATVERGQAESSHTWSYHRLAKVLLHLSEKHGEEAATGTLVKLRLMHEDLANLIGTTRETVTTQLNKFKRMGLLSRRGRQFVVNGPRLAEFVHAAEPRLGNHG